MKNRMTVQNVIAGSIAEEAGIEKGDILLSINGENIGDVFDYRFLMTEETLQLEIEKSDGEIWDIEVEKDEYEDLGLDFENPLMDDMKSCRNKCIFCFIDQLPSGMRETLYFKDDDSRMSFLAGNYVTLTNMKEDDINRIIRYRMSPINVSVHTTNPELRKFMLGNRFAGNVLENIKKLVDGGITVNCQIVLCREVNDGKGLDRTISDLSGFYPGINSISVVPVGITRHREGLFKLEPYDKVSSIDVIKQVKNWQTRLLSQFGSRVVYLADELYIMAETDIPDYEEYEDFPQIENGVGLISLLRYEFFEYLENNSFDHIPERKVSIATGVSSYKYIKEMAEILEKRYKNIKVNVYEIKNNFFGENVTVTGLITGQDLKSQLTGKDLGMELLLCRCMLKADEDIFLDNVTVRELKSLLDTRINIVDNSGKEFVNAVLGINKNL
ncbi:MAG: DUF512 domain-containing protein [Bacillota bacterium]|nr:DUF512 domain-containing protein [Bacillota bacterium]